jgi:hypothetical protein
MKKNILILYIGACGNLVAGWHPLKPMSAYHGQDFHLKAGVAYVEMRRSDTFRPDHGKPTTHVRRAVTLSRKPLSRYGAKTVRDFQRLPMSSKKRYTLMRGGAGHLSGSSIWYYNGFMLDTHGKMWRLETIQDLIDMVRPIDTPAEAKLVLWAHQHAEGFTTDSSDYRARYKKIGRNYLIEEHYAITDTAYGECGIYTWRSTVTHAGHISQRKRISKRPSKYCGGE